MISFRSSMSRKAPHALVLLLVLATPSCAYFNSMYNANRLFADAEKARARGDAPAAETAYRGAIDKANRSLTKHPTSRWTDDALLIIARSRLALHEYAGARQALETVVATSADANARSTAEIQLGLIDAEMGSADAAFTRLERALEKPAAPGHVVAQGLLARARLHSQAGRHQQALEDLASARKRAGAAMNAEIALLEADVAVAGADSLAARKAVQALLHDGNGERWSAALRASARSMSDQFSPAFARSALLSAENGAWRAAARDSVLLFAAELSFQAGDTTGAVNAAERLAARGSGPSADYARVRAARWRLAGVRSLNELERVRAVLLPALSDESARALVQDLRALDVLVERSSRTGQPLLLFAAAELARDQLHAPQLAGRLFLSYADVAPQTVWAPKALLAALELAPADSAPGIRARLESFADNPYVSAVGGTADAEAYAGAEERLSRALAVAWADAAAEAARRENVVGRAVALMDSVRVAARNDSTRISCGIMIDSLAVGGIRADSIRSACMRHDRERIGLLIKIDTLLLRDSTKVLADSLRSKTRARRDTTLLR